MKTISRIARAATLALLVMSGAPSHAQTSVPVGAALAEDSAGEATVDTAMSPTDRMLVSVMVGGAGPYPFIIDTAAERSVVSRELASELGLASAGRARLLSMTSLRDVEMVTMPRVSFVQGQERTLQPFLLNGRNLGASGVLGIDALRGQRVVLDFTAGEMRVGPAPRNAPRPAANEIIVRGHPRFGQLVLVDSSAEGTPVDVIVDSGLQVSVGNEPLRRLLVSRANRFSQINLVSITGESFSADYTRVDNLRIGSVAITGMPVAFSDAYFFRRMQLTRRPALLLGMDALQMFRQVTVDFPNRRAHFLLPQD